MIERDDGGSPASGDPPSPPDDRQAVDRQAVDRQVWVVLERTLDDRTGLEEVRPIAVFSDVKNAMGLLRGSDRSMFLVLVPHLDRIDEHTPTSTRDEPPP